jgi:dihydrofolate synthase/folylpolyglutamate synthase
MVQLLHEAKLHPSLFELFTVMALKLFVEEGVETAVLETGIGGRLDATNYISNPIMTLITPVSFDHMALLGNTIEQIAAQKAGIMQPGVPVVMLKQPYKEAEAVIRRHADELGCPLLQPVSLEEAEPFLPAVLPDFLKDNFRGALAGIRALGLSPKPENFRMPQLRARFDKICDKPLVLLDGAHNGDSMEKLVAALMKIYPGVKWNVVLGCVEGKDIKAMANALSKLEGASFILTNPRTFKGSALPQLQEEMKNLPVQAVIPKLTSREQLPDGPLLFTGSFFTTVIGEDLFN